MDPLRASNKLRRLIRAYHGSPHSFSRFDVSKIGTGEGAQSYGHGLYFAGAEDTADYYRRMLAENADAPERWARDYWEARASSQDMASASDAYDWLLSHVRQMKGDRSVNQSYYSAAEKYLLSQSPMAVPAPLRQGHMYEVEIDYPEEALLDWDAPMSKQPAARQAISEIASHLPLEPPVESMLDMLALDRTGANLYSSLENSISENMDAWSMPDQIRRQRVGGEVSKALLERGVPGIRYLDQGSRSAGEGTRNYVMFPGTEDRIRILRKYGLLPPLAGAGAMGGEE